MYMNLSEGGKKTQVTILSVLTDRIFHLQVINILKTTVIVIIPFYNVHLLYPLFLYSLAWEKFC